jgi:hypothetical protein
MNQEGGVPGKEGSRSVRPYSHSSFEFKYLTRYYQQDYWWSHQRLRHLVSVIKSRGLENADEWERLAAICQIVSHTKKLFLYRELSPLFSQASMDYLFNGWKPSGYAEKVGA